MLKPHDRIFIHLDKTPECDGWTDRIGLVITAVCIADRHAVKMLYVNPTA